MIRNCGLFILLANLQVILLYSVSGNLWKQNWSNLISTIFCQLFKKNIQYTLKKNWRKLFHSGYPHKGSISGHWWWSFLGQSVIVRIDETACCIKCSSCSLNCNVFILYIMHLPNSCEFSGYQEQLVGAGRRKPSGKFRRDESLPIFSAEFTSFRPD